jgi:hypothetical protein
VQRDRSSLLWKQNEGDSILLLHFWTEERSDLGNVELDDGRRSEREMRQAEQRLGGFAIDFNLMFGNGRNIDDPSLFYGQFFSFSVKVYQIFDNYAFSKEKSGE